MAFDADVIIIGLGATGSAAAFHLASRGVSVMGLDRYQPPHTLGSSHGETRIIREAYFEHPAYVPLVQRAYDLWREVERDAGTSLLTITGGLMVGGPESVLVKGALQSAHQHGLRHEILGTAALGERFPQFRMPAHMVAVHEPRAGVLRPEAGVASHLQLARQHGAQLRDNDPVIECGSAADGVWAQTATARYRAKQLVVSAGAWVSTLLPRLATRFTVERQVLHWFEDADPALFSPLRCPVHLWQMDDGKFFYGFPDFGDGLKVAIHHSGASVTADTVDRNVQPDEVTDVQAWMADHLATGRQAPLRSAVCLYTNTTDEHFWLDWYDPHARILTASACSGHGFKFSPVLGEVIANTVMGAAQSFDLQLFRGR